MGTVRGKHQYVCRGDGRVITEKLFGDWLVNFLYSEARERSQALFDALTSPRFSALLAYLNFDARFAARLIGQRRFLESCGVNLAECLDPPASLDTPRKLFERRIRYWECRPMPAADDAVVAPADARLVVGSLRPGSPLFIKQKFFDFEELLGRNRPQWLHRFAGGDWAILRLTPDQYHYNHTPVAGTVIEVYEIAGRYHACNPGAVVQHGTTYSKNKRVVTIIDTDVPGGTSVGLVAMVEVVALMIGEIEPCYSPERYDDPQALTVGMFVRKGVPKSRYRPGSSTDVLLFEKGRVRFAADLVRNLQRTDVASRFSLFGHPVVETDVKVRSLIATRVGVAGGGERCWETWW